MTLPIPFHQFFTFPTPFEDEFSKLANDLFNRDHGFPPYDMYEEEGKVTLEYALAGFTKDEIAVRVENDTLSIEAKKESKDKKKDVSYIKKGIAERAFQTTWTLSKNVDTSKIECTFENGVLKIVIPTLRKDSKVTTLSIK